MAETLLWDSDGDMFVSPSPGRCHKARLNLMLGR